MDRDRSGEWERRTPVLIVGGGPIGLALAAELGSRGVAATLIEQGTEKMGPAKMLLVGVRTMEFCRRLGIADDVIGWGFPEDFCMDNVFVAGGLNGWELSRVHLPSMGGPRQSAESPERQRHCPQTWFDPILRAKASSYPHITLKYETRFESARQDDAGVTVVVRNRNGTEEILRCDYLIGADGHGSTVRRQLGIEMRGEPHLDTSINIELDIEELASHHPLGNAGRYVAIGPEGMWATFVAVDGKRTWRLTLYGANDIDVDAIDVDQAIRRIVGKPFEYRINSLGKWVRRMVVADSFQDGRILLAGDACHTHPPNGGFGMNTGIGDVQNLGWKLEARLKGWGGPQLLASYDKERRPVCHRAANESLVNYRRLTVDTRFDEIENPTPEGERVRRELGAKLSAANAKAWQPVGLHLGHTYDPSPVIASDGTPKSADDTIGYTPTARPGSRAPHFWVKPGVSVLDTFGEGFTLLRFAPVDCSLLVEAARSRGIPFKVFDASSDEGASLYEAALCLVRPDGHVAWRGNEVPDDCAHLIARIAGWGSEAAAMTCPIQRSQVATSAIRSAPRPAPTSPSHPSTSLPIETSNGKTTRTLSQLLRKHLSAR